MRRYKPQIVFTLLLLLAVAFVRAQGAVTVSGVLVLTHLDDTIQNTHFTFAQLMTPTATYTLDMRLTNAQPFRDQEITVTGTTIQTPQFVPLLAGETYLQVNTLNRSVSQASGSLFAQSASTQAVDETYLLIACRYPDIQELPFAASEMAPMFVNASVPQGDLSSYFHEQSFGQYTLAGSTVYPDWVAVPNPRSAYYDDPADPNDGIDFFASTQFFQDCVNAVDPNVDFNQYSQVSIISNYDIGGGYATRAFLTTQETGGQFFGAIQIYGSLYGGLHSHEMGHTLGLPHIGEYRAYDTTWSTMSGPGPSGFFWGQTVITAQASGFTGYGVETIGWIPESRKVNVPAGQSQTVTIERLKQPTSNTSTLLVTVPIPNTSPQRTLYIDVREDDLGYDQLIPGSGVTIVEYPYTSSTGETIARVIDTDNNNTPRDSGSFLTPGQSFSANGIAVNVLSRNGSFYTVRVSNNVSGSNPDANGDGNVTPADAIYVINRIGNAVTGDNAAADVNMDNNITAADAEIVIQALGSRLSAE
ncbi:MAG: dockerin type I domain-containing protein [Chloroflexota bacterium]